MTHVYQLDVDLLGGLHTLSAERGPHFIELDENVMHGETAANPNANKLRDRLLQEAKSFLEIEIDVASRKAAALAAGAANDANDTRSAFDIDAAHRARTEVAALQTRMANLEKLADEVLGVFQLVGDADAKDRQDGVYVRLHWDGYAMESSREAKLYARREHLGLPSDVDWLHASST